MLKDWQVRKKKKGNLSSDTIKKNEYIFSSGNTNVPCSDVSVSNFQKDRGRGGDCLFSNKNKCGHRNVLSKRQVWMSIFHIINFKKKIHA